ncbi:MAG: nucleoside triphosphate pyrophosphohydrolase [Spirochaetaceae bacterium]|nr:nucleoside triphosphate pyrophosphohydrolase [Spirochaetaceae bacterium]
MNNELDLTSANDFTTPALAFERLYKIVQKLRSPEGCPWDRKQTPLTMRQPLIEETFEAVDAISAGDANHTKEELGDVFLNASMIASIHEENDDFTIVQVMNDVCDKIIRRHPHVWKNSEGSSTLVEGSQNNADKVLEQWEQIKQKVEGRKKKSSLDEVSYGLPSLLRAYKIQKKAAKKGFDWKDAEGPWSKIQEEIAELKEASLTKTKDEIEKELGDVLFSVVNLARHLDVDPNLALASTNQKFMKRFAYVEEKMELSGEQMNPENLEIMDKFWDESKKLGF